MRIRDGKIKLKYFFSLPSDDIHNTSVANADLGPPVPF